MFMIATRESTSVAEFSQSEFVDFPVRVLQSFGTQVAPFDTHGIGLHRLQALNIGIDAWQEWFERLVQSQDIGLLVQRDGSHAFVEQWRQRLNTVPFVYSGYSCMEASIEVESRSILDKYYEVISELCRDRQLLAYKTPIVRNPVDLWPGSEIVKPELEELWKRYRARPAYRVHHLDDWNRQLVRDSSLCEKVNSLLANLLGKRPRFLMVYLVNYPTNVFSVVGSSIVIGLNPEESFSSDTFLELLTKSVKAFLNHPVLVN